MWNSGCFQGLESGAFAVFARFPPIPAVLHVPARPSLKIVAVRKTDTRRLHAGAQRQQAKRSKRTHNSRLQSVKVAQHPFDHIANFVLPDGGRTCAGGRSSGQCSSR